MPGKKEKTGSDIENKRRPVADVTIRGVVRDRLNAPLPGVTVQVVGDATRTTTTNAEGRFSISAPEKGNLQFTFVGYKTQLVPINALEIELVLDAAEGNLDEVVVVGFGRQRKVTLVGAQTTINPEELQLPVANISTVLAGRLPGVVGVQRTGEPGRDGADIWIRGIATFGSTAPLVLVDGVERSINNIDPEDVQSFTILKDANQTALYGVRGANGVILVTTKRGRVGKMRLSFDFNEGLTWLTQVPKMADGITYMNLVNESLTTRGEAARYRPGQIDSTARGLDPYLYPNVDWMKEVFKKYGRNRRALVNINGGTSSAQYYVSLGYYEETGMLQSGIEQYNTNAKFGRYNFTSNLTVDLTKSTKMDLGIQGFVSNSDYPGEQTQDIFLQALVVPPVEYPKLYPNGFIPGRAANGGQRNPYADLTRRGYRNEFRNQLYSNLRLTQNLDVWTKGLSVTGMFSFDAFNSQNINRLKRENTYIQNAQVPYKPDGSINFGTATNFNPVATFTPTPPITSYLRYERSNDGRRQFYFESSLNYDRRFGKHAVSGLLLYYQKDRTEAFAGDLISSIPFREKGLAARTTYSFRDKYLIEGTFGYNGSENFTPEKRYGFFPAGGVGWVVSNEEFFNPVKSVVQFLKLRYSDGIVGSSDLAGRRFAYIDLINDNASNYTYGINPASLGGGIAISDYAVDVSWTTARKQNLGLEFRTLNNNLNLVVDYFKERRSGILIRRAGVPGFVGLPASPFGNLAIVDNEGVDGTIEYTFRIKDARISFRGNGTYNNDVIVENDQPTPPHPWLNRRGTNILANYGYIADGLFASQDEINSHPTPGDRSQVKPGDIKYRDLNGDGLINGNDRTRIGRGDVPAFVYGFGLTFSLKGFTFNTFFQGVSNAQRYINGTAIRPLSTDGGTSNMYALAVDRWQEGKANQNPLYPRLAYGESKNFNNTQESSWWIKDISFMRLKSAELSYTFAKEKFRRFGIEGARIYALGTNLLTFTDFKFFDPELNTNNGARYPNVSVVSLGLNVQF